MRWNWLHNKATHLELKYYWDLGKENAADYFAKYILPKIRPNYILKGFNLTTLYPYCSALASPSNV